MTKKNNERNEKYNKFQNKIIDIICIYENLL